MAEALAASLNNLIMLPKNITDILENNDSEDINIQITKVENKSVDPSFEIELSVTAYNDEDNFSSSWIIQTFNYRKCNFSLDFASTIQLNNTHPILWQFSDIQSSLYFSGICSNPDKLFMDLFNTHVSIMGNYVPFENTVHRMHEFSESMKNTSGLLAEGPKRLLISYGGLLKSFNLEFTIIGDRTPTFWDGEKNIQECGNAKVLFFDSSYIIADQFKFIAL